MPRILVHPDRLRLLADHWQRSAAELRGVADRLAGDGLDWETIQGIGVEEEWAHARKLADSLAAQAEVYSRSLVAMADRFEQADRSGSAAVGRVAEGFGQSMHRWKVWWEDAQRPLTLPRGRVDQLLRIGGLASESPGLAAASLVGLGRLAGDLLGGVGFLQPPSRAWQARLDLVVQNLPLRALNGNEGGGHDTGAQREERSAFGRHEG